jgi:hypothetical protein
MPVVPINRDYSNVNEFVDSLYCSDVRTAEPIRHAVDEGRFTAQFSDQGDKVIAVWRAAWRQRVGLPYDKDAYGHCPPQDRRVLGFLAEFVHEHRLRMLVPRLSRDSQSASSDPPRYVLQGYLAENLCCDEDTLSSFLMRLLCGAHFVFIQDSQDLPSGVHAGDFCSDFRASAAFRESSRRHPGSSHYTSTLNRCGWYAPSVPDSTAPSDCPFLVAYLVGLTDSGILCRPKHYSTFLQLEGWQALSARHMADYDLHKQSVWNISTYGASAYSEKRGTTIFLAPEEWEPIPNEDTIMAPYAGAETRQAWLRSDLIRLPQ